MTVDRAVGPWPADRGAHPLPTSTGPGSRDSDRDLSPVSVTVVAATTAFVLALCLAIGQLVHGSTAPEPLGLSSRAYLNQVTAILARYDAARRAGDQLLSERDQDPRLSSDPGWRQAFGQVVSAHESELADLDRLDVPASARSLQACMSDGLRLTALGEGMLKDAFLADGHHAYYLSAHGNWDLNLGSTTIDRCRQTLASPALGGP
jgi:hypothetical protein